MQRGQVGVLAVLAVAVPDDDLVAVRPAPARRDDRAGGHRPDRRAGRDGEVDPGVIAAGPGTGLVVRGSDAGRHGGDETGVLLRPLLRTVALGLLRMRF